MARIVVTGATGTIGGTPRQGAHRARLAIGNRLLRPTPESADDARDPAGEDFLAGVVSAWEQEAVAAAPLCRVAVTRTGVVLSPSGGALSKMLPFFRAGVGGPVAGGRQYVPWVHIDDVVGALLFCLDQTGARRSRERLSVSRLWSQPSRATITGACVGFGRPPYGSGVTSTALTPCIRVGRPTSAFPAGLTPNSTLAGTGAAVPRCNHTS